MEGIFQPSKSLPCGNSRDHFESGRGKHYAKSRRDQHSPMVNSRYKPETRGQFVPLLGLVPQMPRSSSCLATGWCLPVETWEDFVMVWILSKDFLSWKPSEFLT